MAALTNPLNLPPSGRVVFGREDRDRVQIVQTLRAARGEGPLVFRTETMGSVVSEAMRRYWSARNASNEEE